MKLSSKVFIIILYSLFSIFFLQANVVQQSCKLTTSEVELLKEYIATLVIEQEHCEMSFLSFEVLENLANLIVFELIEHAPELITYFMTLLSEAKS